MNSPLRLEISLLPDLLVVARKFEMFLTPLSFLGGRHIWMAPKQTATEVGATRSFMLPEESLEKEAAEKLASIFGIALYEAQECFQFILFTSSSTKLVDNWKKLLLDLVDVGLFLTSPSLKPAM